MSRRTSGTLGRGERSHYWPFLFIISCYNDSALRAHSSFNSWLRLWTHNLFKPGLIFIKSRWSGCSPQQDLRWYLEVPELRWHIKMILDSFFLILSIKCQTVVENSPQPELTSKVVLFCQSNGPKPKNIQFTLVYDKWKHQVFSFEKLETANIWHFFLKNKKKTPTKTIIQWCKIVADYFPVRWLIVEWAHGQLSSCWRWNVELTVKAVCGLRWYNVAPYSHTAFTHTSDNSKI